MTGLKTRFLFALLATCTESTVTTLCGQYDSIFSSNYRYTYGTDQWGADQSGFECMTVDPEITSTDNSTQLQATWMWQRNEQDVHAYPNVQLNSALLPIQLSSLESLTVDVAWTVGVGNEPATNINVTALDEVLVRTDVVLDTFLDYDNNNANNSSLAKVEVMIFLACYGMVPAGYGELPANPPSMTLAGYDFTLITGTGPTGQTVYSWYPSQNITTFNANIAPMFQYLWENNYFYDSVYLGLVQFGTEAEHCEWWQNITFSASRVYLDLQNKQSMSVQASTTADVTSSTLSTTATTITTASSWEGTAILTATPGASSSADQTTIAKSSIAQQLGAATATTSSTTSSSTIQPDSAAAQTNSGCSRLSSSWWSYLPVFLLWTGILLRL